MSGKEGVPNDKETTSVQNQPLNQKGVTSPQTTPPQGAPPPDGRTEDHRFVIATILIVGMLLVMAIPLLQSDYTDTKDLAGIFSGWIVAIVGFYFLQQNAEKAQASSSEAVKTAASATQQAISAADKATDATGKVGKLNALHESTITDFQNTVARFVKQFGERKELGVKAVTAPEDFKAALERFEQESNKKAEDAREKAQKLLAD